MDEIWDRLHEGFNTWDGDYPEIEVFLHSPDAIEKAILYYFKDAEIPENTLNSKEGEGDLVPVKSKQDDLYPIWWTSEMSNKIESR